MGRQTFPIQIPKIEYLGQSPVRFKLRDKAKVSFREAAHIPPAIVEDSFAILKTSLFRAYGIEVIFLYLASP